VADGTGSPMRATLLSRLERLEATTWVRTPSIFQSGWLHELPSEFTGESHIVIVKREPSSPNAELCEFEERPGPAPPNSNDNGFWVCLTR
jgi:hypothetical protein